MNNYVYKDGELYHYGVLGMKWGKRKNPVKAYAKALNVQAKKEARYEKAKAKSTQARSKQTDATDAYTRLADHVGRSKDNMNKANQHLSTLENVDTSGMRRKERKQFKQMVEDARENVNRKQEAYTKSNVAMAKQLALSKELNVSAKKLEKKTAVRKKVLDKYSSQLNKVFGDLDEATIAEGRAIFESARKKK